MSRRAYSAELAVPSAEKGSEKTEGACGMAEVALPLPMLHPGQPARVSRLLAAGPGMARKLSAMGILPGAVLTVLNAPGGPLLLRVGESRIAIGRGMAQRVMVTPCNG